jgi:hypothetical protein
VFPAWPGTGLNSQVLSRLGDVPAIETSIRRRPALLQVSWSTFLGSGSEALGPRPAGVRAPRRRASLAFPALQIPTPHALSEPACLAPPDRDPGGPLRAAGRARRPALAPGPAALACRARRLAPHRSGQAGCASRARHPGPCGRDRGPPARRRRQRAAAARPDAPRNPDLAAPDSPCFVPDWHRPPSWVSPGPVGVFSI